MALIDQRIIKIITIASNIKLVFVINSILSI
jgi:hypothetical protein